MAKIYVIPYIGEYEQSHVYTIRTGGIIGGLIMIYLALFYPSPFEWINSLLVIVGAIFLFGLGIFGLFHYEK